MLTFEDVPDNIMPLPPALLWLDQHELANSLFNKVGRQALRQKKVGTYAGGDVDDASAINASQDGDMFKCNDPSAVKELVFGGADQTAFAMTVQLKDQFSWFAGNLDSLGGLGPQSETVGQDKLIAENSSKRIAEMRDRVMDFASWIVNGIAYYLWTDPLIQIPLVYKIPGSGMEVPMEFNADTKTGEFLDYNIKITPYSLQYETPSQKLMTLMQVWERVILPMAPLLETQGIMPNMDGFLRTIAKYTNMTELEDILIFTNPPTTPEEGPVSGSPGKGTGGSHERTLAPVTKRITERINRPGATRGGKDAALVQTLMGGNPQASERAQISRQVR